MGENRVQYMGWTQVDIVGGTGRAPLRLYVYVDTILLLITLKTEKT
jgi:hypothetical protein